MYSFPPSEPLINERVFSMPATSKMGIKCFSQKTLLNFAFLCLLKTQDTILNLKRTAEVEEGEKSKI
jgi:hypothetical protein